MSSCACRIVAQCRALRDSDTAHSESGDAEISQAHLCRQRRRLWDWSSQSRRSAVLKEHCLLAQAQLARAVRRRRHLLTETMRDAAHLCFCAIRVCKGTRVKVPERASCRARVCILHFSSAHLQYTGAGGLYKVSRPPRHKCLGPLSHRGPVKTAELAHCTPTPRMQPPPPLSSLPADKTSSYG